MSEELNRRRMTGLNRRKTDYCCRMTDPSRKNRCKRCSEPIPDVKQHRSDVRTANTEQTDLRSQPWELREQAWALQQVLQLRQERYQGRCSLPMRSHSVQVLLLLLRVQRFRQAFPQVRHLQSFSWVQVQDSCQARSSFSLPVTACFPQCLVKIILKAHFTTIPFLTSEKAALYVCRIYKRAINLHRKK